MAAAATTDGIPDRLALLRDNGEGCSYLVDTGSAYSILPFTSSAQPTGPALTATSGASIKAWGRCRMQISTGIRHFISRFLQAEVAFPIIGADFLVNFKMAVELSSMQLLCPVGLKIPLEVPRAGSLTAVAIGVVDSNSSPSLPTVEALSSTPTLPTVEALGDSCPKGVLVVPHRVAKGSQVTEKVNSVALEVEQLMEDSTINLRKGYWQILMAAADVPKTAIITPFWLWESLRMPFGLKNLGQTFQRFMDDILAGIPHVFIYLDDVLVASPKKGRAQEGTAASDGGSGEAWAGHQWGEVPVPQVTGGVSGPPGKQERHQAAASQGGGHHQVPSTPGPLRTPSCSASWG